jgi:hypothetical protein
MKELTRWSDDAPADYASAKRAHAELGPDAAQLSRMLARLSNTVDAEDADAQTSAPSAAPYGLASKAWRWLFPVLALLGAGVWLLPATDTAPKPARLPVLPSSPPASTAAAPAAPAAERDAPIPTVKSAPRKSREGPPTAPNPVAELALLERARRILAADPARTLALTDEHRRSFRPGLFAEERELLAIEALVKLKQQAGAAQRARAFSRSHPNSVHARRLQLILQGEAPP